MTADRIARAAALLLEARRSGVALDGLPEDARPQSQDEAYNVQDAVAAKIGPIGGWKTGAASPTAEPGFAPIFAALIHDSPFAYKTGEGRDFGIEAEIAFRLGHDLPPRATPYTEAEFKAAIATIHPVIEVVESRYTNFRSRDGFSGFADNQSNGGLIVGAAAPWPSFDLDRPPVRVLIDGKVAAEMTGNSGGNPMRMATALANHAAMRLGGLKAGNTITTGSTMGIVFAHAGAKVVADFGAFGSVQVSF